MKGILVDLERCMGCRNCEIYCAVQHSMSGKLFEAISERPLPVSRVAVQSSGDFPLPVQCRHCEDAQCVNACPSGALKKDAATGVVIHDRDKCIGCYMCAMVCPYGAVIPDRNKKAILKCDRCLDSDMPACVRACATGALRFVELDELAGKTAGRPAGATVLVTSEMKSEGNCENNR